jgi:serine/threonine protein phosphatase PrpC
MSSPLSPARQNVWFPTPQQRYEMPQKPPLSLLSQTSRIEPRPPPPSRSISSMIKSRASPQRSSNVTESEDTESDDDDDSRQRYLSRQKERKRLSQHVLREQSQVRPSHRDERFVRDDQSSSSSSSQDKLRGHREALFGLHGESKAVEPLPPAFSRPPLSSLSSTSSRQVGEESKHSRGNNNNNKDVDDNGDYDNDQSVNTNTNRNESGSESDNSGSDSDTGRRGKSTRVKKTTSSSSSTGRSSMTSNKIPILELAIKYDIIHFELIPEPRLHNEVFTLRRPHRSDRPCEVTSTEGMPIRRPTETTKEATSFHQHQQPQAKVQITLDAMHRIAVSQTQGGRDHNEDRFSAAIANKPMNACFFAIYDGHGGDTVSTMLSDYLPECIFGALQQLFESHGWHQAFMKNEMIKTTPANFNKEIRKTLRATFVSFDREMHRQNMDKKHENYKKFDGVGSTCTSCLVLGHHVYICNLGDSRSVLFDQFGRLIRESHDHKPDDVDEHKRILNIGGTVTIPAEGSHGVARVDGLAVSRAFGDFGKYKTHSWERTNVKGESVKMSKYDPIKCLVQADPTVEEFTMDRLSVPSPPSGPYLPGPPTPLSIVSSPSTAALSASINPKTTPLSYYLLLGSDGLWDAFGKQPDGTEEAIRVTLSFIRDSPNNLAHATRQLIGYAIKKLSSDNITAMIVQLYINTSPPMFTVVQPMSTMPGMGGYNMMPPSQMPIMGSPSLHPSMQTIQTIHTTAAASSPMYSPHHQHSYSYQSPQMFYSPHR